MNIKRFFLAGLPALLVALASIPLASCSDDADLTNEGNGSEEIHHDYSSSATRNFLDKYFDVNSSSYISRTSDASPWHGQSHRSSKNFNLVFNDLTGEGDYLYVSTWEGVSFNIMKDKTGKDPVWAEDVYDGYLIPLNGNESNLYIADPRGTDKKFSVSFYHVKAKDLQNVFVSSPGRARRGQDHRGSYNFHLTGASRYKVICSDEKAQFDVYYDKSGASDPRKALSVKHGDYLNSTSSGEKAWYMYDVASTSNKPFITVFQPVVVEWMKDLPDELMVSEIAMPGTHDTGTGTLKSGEEGFAKCQNFVFKDQLDFGIRYFDLRVNGNLRIMHGSYDCNTNLDQYFQWSIDFLKAHPSETILMQITDLDGGMPAALKRMMEQHPEFNEYSYRGTQVPKLRDARGKIVFIRRFTKPDDSDWGIDVKSIWPENATNFYVVNSDGVKFLIEDYYMKYSEWVHETGNKRRIFLQALKMANTNTYPDCLSLLFTSVAMGNLHTPWDYAWDSDPSMGDVVKDAVVDLRNSQADPIRSGFVIIMDYYSREGHDDYDHCVERIINLNYHRDTPVFDLERLHSDRD